MIVFNKLTCSLKSDCFSPCWRIIFHRINTGTDIPYKFLPKIPRLAVILIEECREPGQADQDNEGQIKLFSWPEIFSTINLPG